MQVNTTIAGFLTPYQDETVDVGAGATGLTGSKYRPTGDAATREMGIARAALVQVEGRVRYRLLGSANDPTATPAGGHVLNDGDTITLSSYQQFVNFRVIRHESEAANAKLFVTYLR